MSGQTQDQPASKTHDPDDSRESGQTQGYLGFLLSCQAIMTPSTMVCSLHESEEFIGFMLSKAYDVLSEGHFKKHLIQCRDRGDAWAVRMHAQQTRIAQRCRKVQTRIAGMHDTPQQAEWAGICRDVMASAQPPIRVFTGFSRCSLTGDSLDYSIDLTRAGKNSKGVYVHLRFWHFFIFLWFTAKIEYIIRSCTKQWMEALGDTTPEQRKDFTALCERFRAENEPLIQQMAALFHRAHDFVSASVDLYQAQFDVQPVLRPPQAFLTPQEAVA